MLLQQKHCTFFHTENWARVLHESYGYKPVYFISREKHNLFTLFPFMEVKSVLTGNRGVSLPFTDSCEPITVDGPWSEQIVKIVGEFGKKTGWKYLEMRDWPEIVGQTTSTQYIGHSLDLTGSENDIINRFKDTTQRGIKKALKQGVSTKVSTSRDSMEQFARLNMMTRKRHGLPPQPDHFFKKVFEYIISRDLGIIVLASHGMNIVAGSVFFHFNGKAIYKYGASDHAYQHLRANNLVMGEGIRWYRENGYQNLSLGRTEPENEGLRQFKSGWGAVEQLIRYYRYDLKRDMFVRGEQKIFGFHNSLFRRMPIPLLKLSGNLLYRHMG